MSNFYSERKVAKTRKKHMCVGCGKWLEKGSTMIYITGGGNGEISSCYYCVPCREYIDRNPGEDGDEWGEGDVGDARQQEEKEGIEG